MDTPQIPWQTLSVDTLRAGQWEMAAATLVPDPEASKVEFVMFLRGSAAIFVVPNPGARPGWRQIPPSRIMARFVWEATSRPSLGYYALVSQVSPGCSPYLEDLPIHDETDPDAALVACVFRDEDRTLVLRRRYARGAAQHRAVEKTAAESTPEDRLKARK